MSCHRTSHRPQKEDAQFEFLSKQHLQIDSQNIFFNLLQQQKQIKFHEHTNADHTKTPGEKNTHLTATVRTSITPARTRRKGCHDEDGFALLIFEPFIILRQMFLDYKFEHTKKIIIFFIEEDNLLLSQTYITQNSPLRNTNNS